MSQFWIGLLVLAVLVVSGFLIALLIELKKTTQSLREFLKTTGESTKTTMEEMQQTLKSLRGISENIKGMTDDVKSFSVVVRETGQSLKLLSDMVNDISTSVVKEVSGLRVGLRTALEVFWNNLVNIISKKGGKQ